MPRRTRNLLLAAMLPVAAVAAWVTIQATGDQAVAPQRPITPVPAAPTLPPGAPPLPGTVQGPSVDMRWGPVQVTIVRKGTRLADVAATAPTERARSAAINSQAIPWLRSQAIPWLRSEALQAQSADVGLISGATMTSQAFAQSLQAALAQTPR